MIWLSRLCQLSTFVRRPSPHTENRSAPTLSSKKDCKYAMNCARAMRTCGLKCSAIWSAIWFWITYLRKNKLKSKGKSKKINLTNLISGDDLIWWQERQGNGHANKPSYVKIIPIRKEKEEYGVPSQNPQNFGTPYSLQSYYNWLTE